MAVRVGQDMDAGDVMGRLGHTGNSTAPHLHAQLMDGPEPLTARGVPFVFRAYEVETEVGWVRVEGAVPKATDRIRSEPAPRGHGSPVPAASDPQVLTLYDARSRVPKRRRVSATLCPRPWGRRAPHAHAKGTWWP